MTIREFLASLSARSTALRVCWRNPHFGRMTWERWQAEGFYALGARVLLGGLDITGDCVWFDDAAGIAECMVRDEGGQAILIIDSDGVMKTRMHGRIEVVF